VRSRSNSVKHLQRAMFQAIGANVALDQDRGIVIESHAAKTAPQGAGHQHRAFSGTDHWRAQQIPRCLHSGIVAAGDAGKGETFSIRRR